MNISFRCSDYMFSGASVPPPKLDTHSHKYYELLYFINGNASYIVGDRFYRAESGDIFVTAPGEEHSISFNSEDEYERYFIQISPGFLQHIPENLTYGLREVLCHHNNRIPSATAKKHRLHRYFTNIDESFMTKDEKSDFMIRTYILQLAVTVSAIPLSEITYQTSDKKLILDLQAYITQNIRSTLTLDIIASEFFMSKYYLCHAFRKETGMTIKSYIDIQRVAKARDLLINGVKAADIPLMCGFKDYSTFYRTFKRYTAQSPSSILE